MYSSMLGGINLVVFFSLSVSLSSPLPESSEVAIFTTTHSDSASSLSGQYQSDSVKCNKRLKAKAALFPCALSANSSSHRLQGRGAF